MDSMLPIIPISDLQRSPKQILERVRDYAVVQSHGKDRAFILHPELGRILLESGMLEMLRQKRGAAADSAADAKSSNAAVQQELQHLIGTVLRELSKK